MKGRLLIIAVMGLGVLASCQKHNETLSYRVAKLSQPPAIDADWNKSPWKDIQAGSIRNYMGEKPAHRPNTQFKMAYDDAAVYVIFRVEDKYVRSVMTEPQSMVCTDSCVEFFFTPGTDASKEYFNLELNAGGALYFQHQTAPGENAMKLPENDYRRIEIAHSLPRIVEPEIRHSVVWTVEYRLPIDMLTKYSPAAKPSPGVVWRANFYKCADHTSHPHWLTWSYVDFPTPNFHLPEFFGFLNFQ
jgi:hypothetical protein